MAKKKMGRPKLARPKKQTRLNVTCLELVKELKAVLAPPGLELTDAQTFDIAVCTLHELLVEKRLTVVDPNKMLSVLNGHFRRTFAEFLVTTLKGLGHKDVATKWEANGSVTVWCSAGSATIPPEVFGIVNAESLLMEMKTGLQA